MEHNDKEKAFLLQIYKGVRDSIPPEWLPQAAISSSIAMAFPKIWLKVFPLFTVNDFMDQVTNSFICCFGVRDCRKQSTPQYLAGKKQGTSTLGTSHCFKQIMQMSSYTATNPTPRSAGSTRIKELVPCLQRTVPFPLCGLTSPYRNRKYWVTTSWDVWTAPTLVEEKMEPFQLPWFPLRKTPWQSSHSRQYCLFTNWLWHR